MCRQTWAPPSKKKKKKNPMNAEAPGVSSKWVLKNWHSHVDSTTHPSQTNEAPTASKWDWSPFETRLRTVGFWILRKVPVSVNTQCRSPPTHPPPPPTPILPTGVESRKKGTRLSFSTSSIFTHSSWILAANSQLYYWMDVLLCHSEEDLKWNFILE